MLIPPTPSRIPTRRGALISAAGALAVISGFFLLPYYMTAILGGPPHGETAWQTVNSLAQSYGTDHGPSVADPGSFIGTLVLPVALLLFPLAIACLVLLLSIAGFFAPLPRMLVRLQRVLTILGVLPFVVFLFFIVIVIPWLGYWMGVVGYVCMWAGFRRQRSPAHHPIPSGL